jgi:hypothetical protein
VPTKTLYESAPRRQPSSLLFAICLRLFRPPNRRLLPCSRHYFRRDAVLLRGGMEEYLPAPGSERSNLARWGGRPTACGTVTSRIASQIDVRKLWPQADRRRLRVCRGVLHSLHRVARLLRKPSVCLIRQRSGAFRPVWSADGDGGTCHSSCSMTVDLRLSTSNRCCGWVEDGCRDALVRLQRPAQASNPGLERLGCENDHKMLIEVRGYSSCLLTGTAFILIERARLCLTFRSVRH